MDALYANKLKASEIPNKKEAGKAFLNYLISKSQVSKFNSKRIHSYFVSDFVCCIA
jgi:hypothetical protein